MIIGIKDGLKFFGIAIVCACAVFVCTFFLNYYMDASAIRAEILPDALPLYEAQLLTAKFVCLVSGCCLLLVSAVLVGFYVRLYIEGHAKQLGILKAMGFSNGGIAAAFWVFGLSVLVGTLAGYAAGHAVMPFIYDAMGGEGLPEIPITFHWVLPIFLVVLPTAFFAALAILCAYLKLQKSATDLMRDKSDRAARRRKPNGTDRPFLFELAIETLRSHKSLAFFTAFGCFCFSSMVQMAASMFDLASATMAGIIFGIGAVLAGTSLLLALTALTNAHAKTVAIMRACGYPLAKCGGAVLGGYRIPAAVGFLLGTLYQYLLLKLMMGAIFSGVDGVPDYKFDAAVFFCVLAAFAAIYELLMLYFTRRLGKLTVRNFTAE